MTRPNLPETLKFAKLVFNKIPVVVSGGVGSINDIVAVKQLEADLEGVIVGKAIYDGRLTRDKNIVNLYINNCCLILRNLKILNI